MNVRRSNIKKPQHEVAAENFAEIKVSAEWRIDFSVIDWTIDGVQTSLGTPTRGGKYACSERVAHRYEKTRSRVFAFVEHPGHGLIAVSPQEFNALGLKEIVVQQ